MNVLNGKKSSLYQFCPSRQEGVYEFNFSVKARRGEAGHISRESKRLSFINSLSGWRGLVDYRVGGDLTQAFTQLLNSFPDPVARLRAARLVQNI